MSSIYSLQDGQSWDLLEGTMNAYAQVSRKLREEAEAMIAEGKRRLRLADELEKTPTFGPVSGSATPPAPARADVTPQQLMEYITKGGTGRAEHIAEKLGTTPERIKELVAQKESGLTARDRGWIRLLSAPGT